IDDVHLLCSHELAYERVISSRCTDEPEPGRLGLLYASPGTALCTILLDLIVIRRPLRAVERHRRLGAELGSPGYGEGLHIRPHRIDGDRCRHIDARRGPRAVSIRSVATIVRPRLDDFCGNGFAKLDVIRFRGAIGYRHLVGRQRALPFTGTL